MQLKDKLEQQENPPRICKSYLVQWSKLVNGHSGHSLSRMRSQKIGRPRGIKTEDVVENLDVRSIRVSHQLCLLLTLNNSSGYAEVLSKNRQWCIPRPN